MKTTITIGDVYRVVNRLCLYSISKHGVIRDYSYLEVDQTFMIVDFMRLCGFPYVKVLDAQHGVFDWIRGTPKSGAITYFRNVKDE